MHTITTSGKIMSFKESRVCYVTEFRGRKRKEKCNIIIISKVKKKSYAVRGRGVMVGQRVKINQQLLTNLLFVFIAFP